eukprot:TRINITY_DN8652_c0_g1_i1.p1 TRINITY_DN8652_c0_g1~~TRINITY_DN8652_c0_g1_i1.p1  ORF type:complete len:437 (-),score=112.17 TRINITY_DN8652_c0_g1_i1:45-1271(-)
MAAPLRLLLPPLLFFAAATEVFFEERFETDDLEPRWVHSAWTGANGPSSRFELGSGAWAADAKAQRGIRTTKNMNYHGISSRFAAPFSNRGRELVVQFTVKHETHQYAFCGGGYIKLLGSGLDQEQFGGDTPYHIMFGPDLCGYDISRIHLIFSFKGQALPRRDDIKLDYDDKDEFTHLYTLVVKPDNTYEVYFDGKKKSAGSLHAHWDFPNKTNDDPGDRKPAAWVDDRRIDNPAAQKPDDWVDERQIRDPTALQPEEWDEEEDGKYEAPLIDNPAYKGAWIAGKVDNPAYKGEWRPRQLANPAYVEEVYAFDNIAAVGFELWTVHHGSIFDNILVTDSLAHANKVADEVWKPFVKKEKEVKKALDKKAGASSAADDDAEDDDASSGREDQAEQGDSEADEETQVEL